MGVENLIIELQSGPEPGWEGDGRGNFSAWRNSMKRVPCLVLLFCLLVTGCNALPFMQPATSTPMPSNTPEPTFTPLPTDTPTPTPTSTPDKTATAIAAATQTAHSVLDELDKLLGDTEIPYEQGHLAWQQEKQMVVSLSGPSWDYVEIDKDLTARNFILKSDITWEASGIILCGTIFRSEPNIEQGKQYQFVYLRLSGLPAWEIDVFNYGQFQNSPTKTKFSNAIDQGNKATNQVLLVAQDEQFTLYINRARQGKYFDYSKQRMDGVFAFHGVQDSGKGTCKFEDSWIWILD